MLSGCRMQLSRVQNLSVTLLALSFLLLLANYTILTSNYNSKGSTQDLQNPAVEASYIIWNEGSTIYARNGSTGIIEYSGTDAATVINNAITATSNKGGGTVFIKAGSYTIGSSIILKSYVTLEGEGWGEQRAATTLRLADNVNDDVMRTLQQKNYHIIVRNLQIEGNNVHQTAGNGIMIYAADRSVIEFSMIKWCKDSGVCTAGYDGDNCIQTILKNLFIYGCGKYAVYLTGPDNLVQGVDLGNDYNEEGAESALYLHWADKSIIASSFFWGSKHGIVIDQSNNVLVTGCRVDYNRYDGIILCNSSRNVIDGNEIVHNSQYVVGYADGVRLIGSEAIPCNNNTISNNFIGEEQDFPQYHRYAINEEGPYCDGNCIIGNNVHSNSDERIRWSGANTIVCNNIGFVTENSGTATGTSPILVVHGLSKSPTCVTLSVMGVIPYQLSWVNYNSTYIAIYHDAGEGVAITVSWHAEFKP
jgi:parallel beta-helix repeat protein